MSMVTIVESKKNVKKKLVDKCFETYYNSLVN